MHREKIKMEKRTFRIGDLSEKLKIEKFVIRFWEKEFNITSKRSQGGQRAYCEKDLELFKQIKHLLYEQGYTIAGAKNKILKEKPKSQQKTDTMLPADIQKKINILEQQLLNLRKML